MALCSEVSEFTAYFRQALFGSSGKFRIGHPHPCFRLPRPAVLLAKIGLCSKIFDFSPHFRNTRPCKARSSNNGGIRDNIQLSRKRQRAVVGKPNNDPSLSPPHVESTATASLKTSYRNVKQPNKTIIGNDQECCPANNPACSLFRGPHTPASLIGTDYPTRYGPITSNISPTLVAGFCPDGLTLHSPLWYAMRRPALRTDIF